MVRFGTCAVVLLMGCPSNDEIETLDDCHFELISAFPADGATDVFPHADFDAIRIELSGDLSEVGLMLRDAEGHSEMGEYHEVEPGVYTFEPTWALPPNTTYEIGAVHEGCYIPATTFTTGPWDETSTEELAGQQYWLDLENASPGAEGAAGGVAVTMMQGGQLVWFRGDNDVTWVATDGPDTQSCMPTTDAESWVWGPLVQMAPVTAPFGDASVQLWWVETRMDALMGPDGLDRVTLTGQLDAGQVFGCEYFEILGDGCVPCADGQGDTCVDFQVTDVPAIPVDIDVVERSTADCE